MFLKRQNELDPNGLLKNSSVNSAEGRTVEELSQGIPHTKIGVTTAGAIRRAGGTIRRDPLDDNPFHSREMVTAALGEMSDPRAVHVLRDLLRDEQVAGYAVMALGKLGARDARPDIERLLDHPTAWVRKKAKQALAKIDR